jgi:hypothetical protein
MDMGYSCGKRGETYGYDLWDDSGDLYSVEGYATAKEAESAAQSANRRLVLYGDKAPPCNMSLGEIFAELESDQ